MSIIIVSEVFPARMVYCCFGQKVRKCSKLGLSLLLRDSRKIEKTLSKCTRKMVWVLITQDDEFLRERKDEYL